MSTWLKWDIWPWIENVGTAGGFLVAARIYAEGRIRGQAEQVSAWLQAPTQSEQREPQRVVGPDDLPAIELVVLNGSQQPIYRVVVYALAANIDPKFYPVLPPGGPRMEPADGSLMNPHDAFSPGLILDFQDAAGRYWRRGSTGRLRRLYHPLHRFEWFRIRAKASAPREVERIRKANGWG